MAAPTSGTITDRATALHHYQGLNCIASQSRTGPEIGSAYSELADPVEQRRRVTEQSLKAAAGGPEAMQIDEDFLLALENAMSPADGLSIGLDRLVMLLTDTSIREVLTFPFVRPEKKG